MQKIINIIIERIEDLKNLKKSVKSYRKGVQQCGQANNFQKQRIRHMLDDTDRRQNDRSKQQMILFDNIESLKLITQKSKRHFVQMSLRMFKTYDKHFQNDQTLNNTNMNEIHVLYKSFLFKHANSTQNQYFLSFLRRQIDSLNPFIYLGWMGQWSKNLFNELSKTLHHQLSPKKSKYLWKSLKDRINEQQTQSIELTIYSRQKLFGYVLSQLELYYKMMDILDLDDNYLSNLKKMGRKQELSTKNIEQTIDKLIKKNHITSSLSIKQYRLSYARYRNRININKKIQSTYANQSKNYNNGNKSIFQKGQIINRNKYSLNKIKQKNNLSTSIHPASDKIDFPFIQNRTKYDHSSSNDHKFYSKKVKTQQQQNENGHASTKNYGVKGRIEQKGIKYQPLSIVVISSPRAITGQKRYDNLYQHNSLKRHIKYTVRNLDKLRKRLNINIDIGMLVDKNGLSFDDRIIKKQSKQLKGMFQSSTKQKHVIFI